MATQTYRIFNKRTQDDQDVVVYGKKLSIVGDYLKDDAAGQACYDLTAAEEANNAAQFLLTSSLLIKVVADLVKGDDTIILHFGIDENKDVQDSVDQYVHEQYHREKKDYQFVFQMFEGSEFKGDWYSCKYLKKYHDRYYQVELRAVGTVLVSTVGDFDEIDQVNMDALVADVIKNVDEVWSR